MILIHCFCNRLVRKQVNICCSKPVSQCSSALREFDREEGQEKRKTVVTETFHRVLKHTINWVFAAVVSQMRMLVFKVQTRVNQKNLKTCNFFFSS